MNDDFINEKPSREQDVDPGPPVMLLANLEEETSPAFVARIRRRIYRRSAAAQFATFSWSVPAMILMQLLELLGQILSPRRSTPRGGPS